MVRSLAFEPGKVLLRDPWSHKDISTSYRENVSMIASAIASAYSSSTKWPPSK